MATPAAPATPAKPAGKGDATDNTNLIYGIGAAIGVVATYAVFKGIRSLRGSGKQQAAKGVSKSILTPVKSADCNSAPMTPDPPGSPKLAASEVKERIRQASDEQGKMDVPKRSRDVQIPHPPKTTPRVAGAPVTPPSEIARVVNSTSPPNLEGADSSHFSKSIKLRQQVISIAPQGTRTPPTPPSTPAQGGVPPRRGRLRSPDDSKSPPSPASPDFSTPTKSPPKSGRATPGSGAKTPVDQATGAKPVQKTQQQAQPVQEPPPAADTLQVPGLNSAPPAAQGKTGKTGRKAKTPEPKSSSSAGKKPGRLSKTPEPKSSGGGAKRRNKNRKKGVAKTPEPAEPGRKRKPNTKGMGKNRRPSKTPEPKPGKASGGGRTNGKHSPSPVKTQVKTPVKKQVPGQASKPAQQTQKSGSHLTPPGKGTQPAGGGSPDTDQMSESQYSMVTDKSVGGTKRRRRRKKRKGKAQNA